MRWVTATLTATWLGIAVSTGTPGTAAADPVPPIDPAIPLPAPADPVAVPADPAAALEPPGAQQSLLGQFAQAAQMNPFATMQELIASSPQPALIGAPPAPGTAPVPDPWTTAQSLRPENFRMPTDDQVSPYALAPNDNPSPFARVNAFKGVHALAHSNLGRLPGDQLGQPLPGTAPPPGTNIPAGLEQFYAPPEAAPPPPDGPADVPAGTPPSDPLLLPLAPPAPPN